MASLEEYLDYLQARKVPRIELEKNPRIVKSYHYDSLNAGRRAAYVIRHSHIREETEHIRDFEYLIFPQDSLESAIRSAMSGNPEAITCRANRILHEEHTLYGEQIAGTGEQVSPVTLTIRAEIHDTALSLDISYC